MTKPDEVFEAMCKAVVDVNLAYRQHSGPVDPQTVVKAALSAARELGWKIVPLDATQEMFWRFEDAFSLECFKAAIESAPDILAGEE